MGDTAPQNPAAAVFAPEEARLMSRATNLEMAGFLVSSIAGLGLAHAMQFSIAGIATGVAAFVLCETVTRILYWRMTRPLAHLATGETPRFDRAWQAGRLSLDTLTIVGAPLIVLVRLDVPSWLVATGMLIAVLDSFALEALLRRRLRVLNARDAARCAQARS